MSDERSRFLMDKAAETFSEGSDPFTHEWLLEHNVTGDECLDLSIGIGTILYGFLAAPADLRNRITLLGAMNGAGLPNGGQE